MVLGVNLWQGQGIVQTYQNQYPNVLMLRDTAGSVWTIYQIAGAIPLNYVISNDLDQTVDFRQEGFTPATIQSRIQNLLSPVSVELTPGAVQVPQGGTLPFDIDFTNWTSSSEAFWLKLEFVNASGNAATPYGVKMLTVPASQTRHFHADFAIPASAPVGDYRCRMVMGWPGDLWYVDWFAFEIQ